MHACPLRCNFNTEQRKLFLELAQSLECAVHCLVLLPPVNVCQQRVMSRQGHPSLQGKGSKNVVAKVSHAK